MLRLISGPAANPSWRVLERRSHPAAMLGTPRVVQRGGSIGVAMHGGGAGGGLQDQASLLPAGTPHPQLVPVGAVRSHFLSMPQEKDFTYFLVVFPSSSPPPPPTL